MKWRQRLAELALAAIAALLATSWGRSGVEPLGSRAVPPTQPFTVEGLDRHGDELTVELLNAGLVPRHASVWCVTLDGQSRAATYGAPRSLALPPRGAATVVVPVPGPPASGLAAVVREEVRGVPPDIQVPGVLAFLWCRLDDPTPRPDCPGARP